MKNNKGGWEEEEEGLLQRGAVFEGRGGCLIEDLRYDTTWLGRYCVFLNKPRPGSNTNVDLI